jgi:hypothetical protein
VHKTNAFNPIHRKNNHASKEHHKGASIMQLVYPYEYLTELFETDEIAAVRIANRWGSNGNPDALDQYLAAWQIALHQTVFPVCILCRWPVVDDEHHASCEEQLRFSDDASYHDVMNQPDEAAFPQEIEDTDICDGICGQPANACTCAETEAYRQHEADPDTRGSWFVA